MIIATVFQDRLDDLAISGFVRNVVHLIAMHEHRSVLAPKFSIAIAPITTKIKETWMGGSHSDIDGGVKDEQEEGKYYRRRMISLRCILTEAKWEGPLLKDDWDAGRDFRMMKKVTSKNVGSITAGKTGPFSSHKWYDETITE